MSPERVTFLLGRRDEPTDALEDYCAYLAESLAAHDFECELRWVPWAQHGWPAALEALRLQARGWRGRWVFVQYTALAWSSRGFPFRFPAVLRILAKAGARIGVVFHDAEPFGGTRVVDRLRRAAQLRAMRRAAAAADAAVFPVPPERLSWPEGSSRNLFIPVGPNLPGPLPQDHANLHAPPAVAVYGITGGAAGEQEARDIVGALRFAARKLGSLRLVAFGRHAELRQADLEEGLRGFPVEVEVHGLLAEEQLADCFSRSDLLLFVRGAVSSRRSSALAGVACGLPVVALEGSETAPPVTDAGVLLLAGGPQQAALEEKLGEAVVRILSDEPLRRQLVERSRRVYGEFFSWEAVSRRYAERLRAG